MRSAILLSLLLAAAAATATAQPDRYPGGHIGLYADFDSWGECSLSPVLFTVNNVYVVHVNAVGGTQAQFQIEQNWTGPTVLPAQPDYGINLWIGDVETGATVLYQGCGSLPYLVVTLRYIPVGASEPCTYFIHVRPHPDSPSGDIEVIDCASNVLSASGGDFVINGTEECAPFTYGCPTGPVRTESATWGRVKSLYGRMLP